MQEQGDIIIVTFLAVTSLEQPYHWTFRLSKYKDCIMCFYYLIAGKNLPRKNRSALDFWENEVPTSPHSVLVRPVLSKTPLDILPTLLTVIFQFSSSLWKWLVKNSLSRKLCHYLETSQSFAPFQSGFEGCRRMKEGGREEDDDRSFSFCKGQRCWDSLGSPAAFRVAAHAVWTCCQRRWSAMAGGKGSALAEMTKVASVSPGFSVGKDT